MLKTRFNAWGETRTHLKENTRPRASTQGGELFNLKVCKKRGASNCNIKKAPGSKRFQEKEFIRPSHKTFASRKNRSSKESTDASTRNRPYRSGTVADNDCVMNIKARPWKKGKAKSTTKACSNKPSFPVGHKKRKVI